jgi:hypothetical protein
MPVRMFVSALALAAAWAAAFAQDGYLWVSCEHVAPFSLYRYSIRTHRIDMILTLSLLDTRVYNNLAFDGTNMYVGTNSSDLFAKVDPWTGRVRSVGSYSPPQSLFFEDGAYNPETGTLWRAGNDLIETDTSGNVLNTWAFNGQIYGLEWAHGTLWMTDYSHFGYIELEGGTATFVEVPLTGAPVLKVSLAYDHEHDLMYIAGFIAATQSVHIYSLSLSTMQAQFVADLTQLGYPVGWINPDALCWIAERPEAWVARYDGPVSGVDTASAMVVDAAGNVYVAGCRDGGDTHDDALLIKYSCDGEEVWSVPYDGPVHGSDTWNGIALVRSGGVCVTGRSDGDGTSWDIVTARYGENGAEQWVRRFDGPTSGADLGNAVVADATGNVYVAGYVWGPAGDPDYKLLKYSPTGTLTWDREYTNTYRDVATDVALDSFGDVVISGWSASDNGLDYFTQKYDADGNWKWNARYDGPGHWDDVLKRMVVDGEGNVYLTGRSWGDGVSWDFGTVKYSPSGEELWTRRIDLAGGPDEANDLALTPQGVVVTGWTMGANPDVLTASYDAAGKLLWLRTYKGPGDGTDRGHAVVADQLGNIYVAGRSQGELGVLDWDAVTIQYDRYGGRQWDYRYNGPADDDDGLFMIGLDAARAVYVGGTSVGDGTNRDWLTMKYGATRKKPDRETILPMGPHAPPGR